MSGQGLFDLGEQLMRVAHIVRGAGAVGGEVAQGGAGWTRIHVVQRTVPACGRYSVNHIVLGKRASIHVCRLAYSSMFSGKPYQCHSEER